MWYNIHNKYFDISNENKVKFFYKYDSKKLYKTFNTQGQYILTGYNIKKSSKYFFINSLFIYKLSQFNHFDLINLSFLRKFLSQFLVQLVYLNYYFSGHYINFQKGAFFPIYNVWAFVNKKIFINFYKKLLLFYFLVWVNTPKKFNTIAFDTLNYQLDFSDNFLGSLLKSSYLEAKLSNFYVLYFKASLNNLFITLTENGSAVLLSQSGGRTSSKKKKTTLTVFFMLSAVISYLQKHSINQIDFIIVRSTWYRIANVILAPLKKAGILVNYVGFDLIRSHNGLRKRKLRRL